ncbi:MAG TPA: hypothetical protein PLB89_13865 [Flavobacteriales bacterium]|nr:hypothetical protein [Flavobacteriales bacterium]
MDRGLTRNEEALPALLAEHQHLGNGKARELLGWDAATYATTRQGLLAKVLRVSGRGRGGSIRLAKPRGPVAAGLVADGSVDLFKQVMPWNMVYRIDHLYR